MQPDPEEVRALAAVCGRELDQEQAGRLAVYLGLLASWNRRMNLVGPADWREVLRTLVPDGWVLADFLTREAPAAKLTLDLGAGAGLPGIPLRLFYHSGRHILVEPRQKRTIFLTYALGALDLPGMEVRRCRAEELPEESRSADVVLSKAFMPWREYLDVARPLLAEDGLCLVLSSERPPAEPPEGWRAGRSVEYEVAGRYRSVWSFTPAICSRNEPL